MQRIGIFGGTFDPPHLGHLIAAEKVREKFALEKILFVPAAIPPHKQQQPVSDATHRLAMTMLATQDNASFEASDVEIHREGPSYTVDTLTELSDGRSELYLIIGTDQLGSLRSWHRFTELFRLSKVVVVARSQSLTQVDAEIVSKVELLPMPLIDISSTGIRRRVKARESIRYLVPENVREYIEREGLYK